MGLVWLATHLIERMIGRRGLGGGWLLALLAVLLGACAEARQPVPVTTEVVLPQEVLAQPVQIELSPWPLHGRPPFTATFAAQLHGQPSWASERVLESCRQILWSFGDGATETVPCGEDASLGASHTYERPGTYHARLRVVQADGDALESTTRTIVVAEPQPAPPGAALLWWGAWAATAVGVVAALLWLRRRSRRWQLTGLALLGLLLVTFVPPFSYLPNPAGFFWGRYGGYNYDPRLPFVNRFVIAGDPAATLRPYLDGLIGQTGLDPLDPQKPLAAYEFVGVRVERYRTLVATRLSYADGSRRTYEIPVFQPDSFLGYYGAGWRYDGLARLRTEHRQVAGIPFAGEGAALRLGAPERIAPETRAAIAYYAGSWTDTSYPETSHGPLLWSPSGDAFLVKRMRPGGSFELWLVPLRGGRARLIADDVGEVGWALDGERVLFIPGGRPIDEPATPLFVVETEGGPARRWLSLENHVSYNSCIAMRIGRVWIGWVTRGCYREESSGWRKGDYPGRADAFPERLFVDEQSAGGEHGDGNC